MKQSMLFLVSAATGTGKTTLVNEVLHRMKNIHLLQRVVTYTTRAARPDEKNGLDYHFVSHDEFVKKMNENFFCETSRYHEKWYGTPISFLEELKRGISQLAIVDRKGMKSLLHHWPTAVTIWISAPNLETVRKRMIKRGGESKDHIQHRLELAQAEMNDEEKHRLCTYHIINDVFEVAVEEFTALIAKECNV